jgi:hypothetical protein
MRYGYAAKMGNWTDYLWRVGDFLSWIRVVAQPWRRAGKLGILSGLCVAPLRLGGLRGKQSTPSDWLGGTGEVSTVGGQERQGAQARDSDFGILAVGHRYASPFV